MNQPEQKQLSVGDRVRVADLPSLPAEVRGATGTIENVLTDPRHVYPITIKYDVIPDEHKQAFTVFSVFRSAELELI